MFYLKNVKTQKIWMPTPLNKKVRPEKFEIRFTPDSCKYNGQNGNIKTKLKIVVSPNEPVEIRKLEIENTGEEEEILEISSTLEPVLSTKEQEYAHPAFNKLFLKSEYLEQTGSILVERKS